MEVTWHIDRLKRTQDTGFVFEIDYAISFDLEGIVERRTGTVHYEVVEGDITPFEELTQDQVKSWIQDSIGSVKIQNLKDIVLPRLQARLDRKNNVNHLEGTPWTS